MNGFLSGAQLKDKAKDRLTGHFGLLIGAGIAVSAISSFISLLPARLLPLQSNTLFTYALSDAMQFIVSVFTGVFQVGTTLLFLKCACGAKAVFSDIFYGFSHHIQTALGISLLVNAAGFLPFAAYRIPHFCYLATGESRFVFLMCAGVFLSLIIYIPLSLYLSQCFFLMLDFPDKGVREILASSIRIMKGHKARLFYIELSFLPLVLLGVLSVIGLLWVRPYAQMTMALFYLDIMKKPEQKN